MKMKKSYYDKGITLIALVVTIIVLLILAGITLSAVISDNGLLNKAKIATQKYSDASRSELSELEKVADFIDSEQGYNELFNQTKNVNNPKLTKGMIPIKWNGSNWVVTDENDSSWFDYDTKKWANIMLSDGTYKQGSVQVGQVVQEDDLGSMYVWIPRYAYKMNYTSGTSNKNAGGSIDITFLKGNSNVDKDGRIYQKDSNSVDTSVTPIVHPGFTFGNQELPGIWVSKFEASSGDTGAKSLPSKIAWRSISIGEAEYQSMLIAGKNKDKYGIASADSHLIKNVEWGAVAYMCYSSYGVVPKLNGCGGYYTGMGVKSSTEEGGYSSSDENLENHKYTTELGKTASTTGNVTGVYDLNGGADEYVAGYLDNGNDNLNKCGKNNEGNVKFFENGKLNTIYEKYFDKYEIGNEFKQETIKVEVEEQDETREEILNVSDLYNSDYTTLAYNVGRQLYSKSIWDKLTHGIGMSEVSNSYSFNGAYLRNGYQHLWNFFETAKKATDGTISRVASWDNDTLLILGPRATHPFVVRGGSYSLGTDGGVLHSSITNGESESNLVEGFRSVIV